MRIPIKTALHGASILSTGLSSGLFYGWTVSVIPGTRLVSDYTYVETMQRINTAIINPGFVPIFLSPPLFMGVAALMHLLGSGATTTSMKRRGQCLAVSTILYMLGVIGPTCMRNIPLNNALASFDPLKTHSDALLRRMRQNYETPWNQWHNVRTAASVGSFLLTLVAALWIETPHVKRQ